MKVRCINNNGMEWLKLGCIYEVSESLCLNYMIKCHSVLKSRFEIVEDNMEQYTIQEFKENEIYMRIDTKRHFKRIDDCIYYALSESLENWKPCVMSLETLNAKFTLVKQDKEVSFMDAMKAYDEGKIIYCKWIDFADNDCITKFKVDSSYNFEAYNKQILEGTWYIKAD